MKASRIGEAARTIRETSGLSQLAMAGRLGITNAHLCMIESGKSNPSLKLLARYWEEFGRDPYIMAHRKYIEAQCWGPKRGTLTR